MMDVTNRKILLLGGGKASAEKLRTLAQLNLRITAISPQFIEEFHSLDWIDFIYRKYQYGDLEGFDIVYCGINDPIEEKKILQEAKERKVLINFIDQVEDSDFISASTLIRENFTLFISTYGKSPGGAKMIREEIESKIDLSNLDRQVGVKAKEREMKKKGLSV
ncbi:MAG TPA: NAD(P)-dependent oxidoreductase [Leptospiraceae bacterium]|nr:NAD(P)-dependent oxidoreductase [Leptospiraceae bacterium]HNA07840.1 NAD(P)-dependent oxidoreductase [Leptospiraceae bacterium]HNC53910.1 NAD(P)-dependent oxidoreductase [Leptospiraceae bacterium]HNE51759.1 NAD(P)-dependent oxidoreductase [Leptospiraceae bacterium]HNF53446.1 NAD(P)-dependent oxidoreductase [Leptospiraceae bacterium]